MKNPVKANIAWIIAGLVFLIHFLPYFIYPGDAYIRIHDTLEGEWIWLHILNETGTAWNINPHATIPQIMNGLPRSAMPTGLSVMMLAVTIFGTYWGYVINYILVHLVGFWAMKFFLDRYVFKDSEQKYLSILCALIFSLIPVYTPFGLSVMGQPIILHIFILFLNNRAKIQHYVILLVFPFYSSIVWAGMPILMAAGSLWIFILIKNRRLYVQYLVGIVVLGIGYALINYPILQLMFYPPNGFISHRTAYNLYMFGPPSILTSLVDFLHQFFTIHYHVGTMLTLPPIIIILAVYKRSNSTLKNILRVILLIVLFQAGYSFFEYFIGSKIGFIKSFRLNRLNILLPLLWITALALAMKEWEYNNVLKRSLLIGIICTITTTSIGNDEILNNYRRMLGLYHLPTYRAYMAPDQFDEIQKFIDADPSSYRVACFGMNPSILQFNGFYTLDGLQSVYDLNYKNEFRKIFARELEPDTYNSEIIREYFDGWGNRCCIYSPWVGKEWNAFMLSKEYKSRFNTLALNGDAFKALGGKYLISATAIQFTESDDFLFVKDFDSKNSFWHIYLYQVK